MSCQLIDDLHPNRDASSLETMLKGKGPKGSETGEAPQKASKTCSLACSDWAVLVWRMGNDDAGRFGERLIAIEVNVLYVLVDFISN